MDLSKYSAKDAKIIKDNPGKTPFELARLGLSPRGFERLLSELKIEEKEKAEATDSDTECGCEHIPEGEEGEARPRRNSAEFDDEVQEDQKMKPDSVKKVVMNQPKLSDYQPTKSTNQQRTIVGRNGIPRKMNAARAIKLAAKYPNEFKLLD